MDTFFLEYRDPIFGIVIFVFAVFVIAFANYWWGIFKSNEEKHNIEQFIKKFDVVADVNEYKKLLDEFSIPSESLSLLAHSYAKNGEYEKAISIYLIAVKRVKNKSEKQYVLRQLGNTYFKAGFLRRSSEVLLETLKLGPRDEEALKLLTVIYEQLKEYNRSLEVLDALLELGTDVELEKKYVSALKIVANNKKTDKEKLLLLETLSHEEPLIERMKLEFAKRIEQPFNIAHLNPTTILDILWECDDNVLKESSHLSVKAIRAAKGYIEEIPENAPFELEVLANLKKVNYVKAGLIFEYTCQNCKGTFPMEFYRCPACHTLKLPYISMSLTKTEYEAYYSF